MGFFEDQLARITNNETTIVYSEGTEPTIIKSAAAIVAQKIATPILVGKIEKIESLAAELNVSLAGVRLIDPATSDKLDEYAAEYANMSGFPDSVAKIMMKKPLYFSSMMAKLGDADCMVSGLATETAEVVAAYKLIIGMREGIKTPSCISILESPTFEGEEGHLIALSDTAINAAPTAEELADIAIASAGTVSELMGWTPRVAMLSFSTLASANHERAQLVAEAVRIAKERAPELYIDGEMQADTALAPEVAKRKFTREGDVAGRANVLVFPNLDASNIGIKLLQRLGNCKTSGGVLQGFARPVCDLSRGANSDNIVRNSVVLVNISNSLKNK